MNTSHISMNSFSIPLNWEVQTHCNQAVLLPTIETINKIVSSHEVDSLSLKRMSGELPLLASYASLHDDSVVAIFPFQFGTERSVYGNCFLLVNREQYVFRGLLRILRCKNCQTPNHLLLGNHQEAYLFVEDGQCKELQIGLAMDLRRLHCPSCTHILPKGVIDVWDHLG